MNKHKKNKKRLQGKKSLNDKFEYRKLKKIAAKRGSNVFICEAHAHGQGSCGARFNSFTGSVVCPECGNQYCRWENYKEPVNSLSKEASEYEQGH